MFDYIPKTPNIEPLSMDFIVPETAKNELTFLYKLRRGIVEHSFGMNCARLAGIDEKIIERAKEVQECFAQGRVVSPIRTQAVVAREVCVRTVLAKLKCFSGDPDLDEFLALLRSYNNDAALGNSSPVLGVLPFAEK